jgi:hypothetical protein
VSGPETEMKTFALIAAALLSACTTEPVGPDAGAAPEAVATAAVPVVAPTTAARSTTAPAAPAASAATAAPELALDDATLLAGRGLLSGSLPEIQLLGTPRGRELMSRVVSCALPRGAAVTAITRDGTPYSFAGVLGLAPGWADHAPTGDERRRVTECLRSRAPGATET